MFFALFNEVGIIHQLSTTRFQSVLPQGVLVSHFSVLNSLVRVKDGRTPLELANAFEVPKTTMTHTLAGLEGRGWVTMRPNPKDKRSKQVWITPEGHRFREEAIASVCREMGPLLANIDVKDVRAALPFLAHVRQVLDRARD